MLEEQQDAQSGRAAFRLRAAAVPSSAKVGAGGHRDHPARGPGRAGDLRAGWCELREPAGPAVVLRADRDPGAQHAGAAQALPGAAADPAVQTPVLHHRRHRSLRHPAASRLQEILPGLRTPILGYQGTFPGPTLEARSGRRVVVTTVNELGVPTVVHLHGGHTPADSDGSPPTWCSAPAFAAEAVDSATYTYPCQRAATLWYHDHRMDFTGPQVCRGLAGFHLVTDDEEDGLPLPPATGTSR